MTVTEDLRAREGHNIYQLRTENPNGIVPAVFVDGQQLVLGVDYRYLRSSNGLYFSLAPSAGSRILVVFPDAISLGSPSRVRFDYQVERWVLPAIMASAGPSELLLFNGSPDLADFTASSFIPAGSLISYEGPTLEVCPNEKWPDGFTGFAIREGEEPRYACGHLSTRRIANIYFGDGAADAPNWRGGSAAAVNIDERLVDRAARTGLAPAAFAVTEPASAGPRTRDSILAAFRARILSFRGALNTPATRSAIDAAVAEANFGLRSIADDTHVSVSAYDEIFSGRPDYQVRLPERFRPRVYLQEINLDERIVITPSPLDAVRADIERFASLPNGSDDAVDAMTYAMRYFGDPSLFAREQPREEVSARSIAELRDSIRGTLSRGSVSALRAQIDMILPVGVDRDDALRELLGEAPRPKREAPKPPDLTPGRRKIKR